MLTAQEYINKVIEYRRAGRFDLIHEMATRRAAANRALRKGQPMLLPDTPPDIASPIQQSLVIEQGKGSGREPTPTVAAPV